MTQYEYPQRHTSLLQITKLMSIAQEVSDANVALTPELFQSFSLSKNITR